MPETIESRWLEDELQLSQIGGLGSAKHAQHNQLSHGRGAGGGSLSTSEISEMANGRTLNDVGGVQGLLDNHSLEPTDNERNAATNYGKAMAHECYNQSASFAMSHGGAAELVHGSYDPGETGLRFGHAWVELPGGRVFDGALQTVIDAKAYHKSMGTESEVRYKSGSVLDNMAKHMNWGPWHKGKSHSGDKLAAVLAQRSRKATEVDSELVGVSTSYQHQPIPTKILEELSKT